MSKPSGARSRNRCSTSRFVITISSAPRARANPSLAAVRAATVSRPTPPLDSNEVSISPVGPAPSNSTSAPGRGQHVGKGIAAVHQQLGARTEGRFLTQQPGCGCGDLLRLGDPSQRRCALPLLVQVVLAAFSRATRSRMSLTCSSLVEAVVSSKIMILCMVTAARAQRQHLSLPRTQIGRQLAGREVPEPDPLQDLACLGTVGDQSRTDRHSVVPTSPPATTTRQG